MARTWRSTRRRSSSSTRSIPEGRCGGRLLDHPVRPCQHLTLRSCWSRSESRQHGRRHLRLKLVPDPYSCPRHGEQECDRAPQAAREQQPRQCEGHHPKSNAQDDHLRDRRTLPRWVGDSTREIHHVWWAAHTEERSQHAAGQAGGHGPTPSQSVPHITANDRVEGICANETSERPKGGGPWKIDEKSHSEHKT